MAVGNDIIGFILPEETVPHKHKTSDIHLIFSIYHQVLFPWRDLYDHITDTADPLSCSSTLGRYYNHLVLIRMHLLRLIWNIFCNWNSGFPNFFGRWLWLYSSQNFRRHFWSGCYGMFGLRRVAEIP